MNQKANYHRYGLLRKFAVALVTLSAFFTLSSNAQEGKQLFEKNCAVCHQI